MDRVLDEQMENAAANRALHELVARYGSAVALDLAAYDGTAGLVEQSKRSLKSIAESRLGKTAQDASRNIHQQAGFSAEIIETTEINKRRIISGEKVRNFRLDDLGKTNDQLVDTIDAERMADGTWREISGTGIQMKFIGKNGSETFDKLCQSRHNKYFENGVPVKIPKDYYSDFLERADEKINGIKLEISTLKANKADPVLISQKQERLKKYETVRKNTYSSETSSSDALLARTNPQLYTAKSVLTTAHGAGLQGAQSGAIIGGGLSIINNLDAVINGKPIDVAIKDVAASTTKSAIRSYAVAGGGAFIDGEIKHFQTDLPKLLKNAKAPTEVAGFIVDAASSFYSYYRGDISGVDCMKRLASGAVFALANLTPVGQVIFVARTIYTLASISVSVIGNALKAPGIARERRIQIEQECNEQIRALKEFRKEYEMRSRNWVKEKTATFVAAFDAMDNALRLDDVDAYIAGANQITHALGGKTQFENRDQFKRLMNSDEAFVL